MKVESTPLQIRASVLAEIHVEIDCQSKLFLLDTGADMTSGDYQYLDLHPELFERVRSEDGTDAHCHKIPSEVYRIAELEEPLRSRVGFTLQVLTQFPGIKSFWS